MTTSRRAPQKLKIVAYLFLIGGLSSLASIIPHVLHGKFNLNLGVFMIPVGWGLLQLKPNSHWWATFWCWLGFILLPFAFFALIGDSPQVTIFGQPLDFLPRPATVGLGLLMITVGGWLNYWSLQVLHSPPVRWAFDLDSPCGEEA